MRKHQPCLRLSPNEEEELFKKEQKKLQIFRLLQVREQAKAEAARRLKQCAIKERNAIGEVKALVRDKWEEQHAKEVEELQSLYEICVHEIGSAHVEARKQEDLLSMKAEKERENRIKAVNRGMEALCLETKIKEDKQMDKIVKIKPILKARHQEKCRAKKIASLPPSVSFQPVKELPKKQQQVILHEANTFYTSKYKPDFTPVRKEQTTDSFIDPREAAKIQQEIIDNKKETKEEERRELLRLTKKRGIEALKKEQIKLQHQHLLNELDAANKKHQISAFILGAERENNEVIPDRKMTEKEAEDRILEVLVEKDGTEDCTAFHNDMNENSFSSSTNSISILGTSIDRDSLLSVLKKVRLARTQKYEDLPPDGIYCKPNIHDFPSKSVQDNRSPTRCKENSTHMEQYEPNWSPNINEHNKSSNRRELASRCPNLYEQISRSTYRNNLINRNSNKYEPTERSPNRYELTSKSTNRCEPSSIDPSTYKQKSRSPNKQMKNNESSLNSVSEGTNSSNHIYNNYCQISPICDKRMNEKYQMDDQEYLHNHGKDDPTKENIMREGIDPYLVGTGSSLESNANLINNNYNPLCDIHFQETVPVDQINGRNHNSCLQQSYNSTLEQIRIKFNIDKEKWTMLENLEKIKRNREKLDSYRKENSSVEQSLFSSEASTQHKSLPPICQSTPSELFKATSKYYTTPLKGDGSGQKPVPRREKFDDLKKSAIKFYIKKAISMNPEMMKDFSTSSVEGSGLTLNSIGFLESLSSESTNTTEFSSTSTPKSDTSVTIDSTTIKAFCGLDTVPTKLSRTKSSGIYSETSDISSTKSPIETSTEQSIAEIDGAHRSKYNRSLEILEKISAQLVSGRNKNYSQSKESNNTAHSDHLSKSMTLPSNLSKSHSDENSTKETLSPCLTPARTFEDNSKKKIEILEKLTEVLEKKRRILQEKNSIHTIEPHTYTKNDERHFSDKSSLVDSELDYTPERDTSPSQNTVKSSSISSPSISDTHTTSIEKSSYKTAESSSQNSGSKEDKSSFHSIPDMTEVLTRFGFTGWAQSMVRKMDEIENLSSES